MSSAGSSAKEVVHKTRRMPRELKRAIAFRKRLQTLRISATSYLGPLIRLYPDSGSSKLTFCASPEESRLRFHFRRENRIYAPSSRCRFHSRYDRSALPARPIDQRLADGSYHRSFQSPDTRCEGLCHQYRHQYALRDQLG